MKKQISFASLGDLCMDIYPEYKNFFPGGTAFNTAVGAAKAGAYASIFSAIGMDIYASIFLKAFTMHGVNNSHVKILQGESSSIRVSTDGKEQPYFSDWKLGVLKTYQLQSADRKELRKYDVVKMTLFKPLHKLFKDFCQINLPLTIKAADFAGSSAYSEGIFTIQRYINQLDIIIKSLEIEDHTSLAYLRQMSIDYKEKVIIVLLGKKGSIVFLNGKQYKQPAMRTSVKDTNGAGDAYVAHFLVSYSETRDIPQAMLKGGKAASEKIIKAGATI